MIGSNLYGRVFSNTINNEVVSYELSQETLDKLNNIKDGVFSVFQELKKH
jgi:hypothetical protein